MGARTWLTVLLNGGTFCWKYGGSKGESKMTSKRPFILALVLATTGYSGARAGSGIIAIDTRRVHTGEWTVAEVSGGQLISAPAVYNGIGSYGDISNITIPFTDCDGLWYAKRRFRIPLSATNLVFTITGLGVDDRAVIVLNHVPITSVGTTANGQGYMQFIDSGNNRPYDFQFIAGKVSFADTVHLHPGLNELLLIVNNTDQGINGTIDQPTSGNPTNVGIAATVTYTQ
jgi:hypothetical protein